MGESAVDP
jgi:SNF2 family DNA or RNA helicase